MDQFDFYAQYEDFLRTLPNPELINLPGNYFCNYRGWEFFKCLETAKFTKKDVVLDTGALHTFFCLWLSKLVKKVHATDNFYWAERDYARSVMPKEDWKRTVETLGNGHVKVYPMDLQAIALANDTFNHIVCISTIEHVINDRDAILEMMRVLKPGGYLMFTSEYKANGGKEYSEIDGTYYRVYNRTTLNLLTDGLPVVVETINPHEPYDTVFVAIRKPVMSE